MVAAGLVATTTAAALALRPGISMSALSKGKVAFQKYHGLGNDFILVDNRSSRDLVLSPEQAARLCDRNFGVGGDGVIFAMPGDAMPGAGADYVMRIINSDGSEPEMCGNGIRCMAKFVAQLEGRPGQPLKYIINTAAGTMVPEISADGQVTVDMGEPILHGPSVPTTLPTDADGRVIEAPMVVAGRDWKVTCVSMGNPHAVVFVDELDDKALPLSEIGPQFENHPVFPSRTNTEFVKVESPTHLRMRVWERGAGPTLACGTGACALLVAAVLAGKASRSCTVTLPGGDLFIEWRQADNKCIMTGPADLVFEGEAML